MAQSIQANELGFEHVGRLIRVGSAGQAEVTAPLTAVQHRIDGSDTTVTVLIDVVGNEVPIRLRPDKLVAIID